MCFLVLIIMAMMIMRPCRSFMAVHSGAAGRGSRCSDSGGVKKINMSRMNGCTAESSEEHDGIEADGIDGEDASDTMVMMTRGWQ